MKSYTSCAITFLSFYQLHTIELVGCESKSAIVLDLNDVVYISSSVSSTNFCIYYSVMRSNLRLLASLCFFCKTAISSLKIQGWVRVRMKQCYVVSHVYPHALSEMLRHTRPLLQLVFKIGDIFI